MRIAAVLPLLVLAAGCKPPAPTWQEAAATARAAFAEQSSQSLYFRLEDRLAQLAINPFNGFCFLLDEAFVPDLSLIGPAPEPKTGELAAFVFPRDADMFFSPNGLLGSGEDSLVLTTGGGAYLTNRIPLNLPREELEEISIRLRLDRNQSVSIGLSASSGSDWVWENTGRVDIQAEPGEDFRRYRLHLPSLLDQSDFMRNVPPGEPVRQFFLSSGDWLEGEVEVSSIRFFRRGERYLREPYGAGYLTLGDILRRGLWMPVPGKLSWEVELPAEPAFFRAGAGLFWDSSSGVEYRVKITAGEEEETLIGGSLEDSSGWTDIGPLDLERWSAQTVTLTIETRGEEANTVFWGDPAIREYPRKRFNVVVILEDALRAGHLGCYGYPRAVTPVRDRLAAEGILFETAVSQATMTRPSCPSILTSLYPSATGVWNFQDSLDENFLTLAEVLRSQGFLTAAFIQNPAGGAGAGLQQGFGELYGRDLAGYLTAHLLPDQLGAWLENNDRQNFFLYIHLLKPHGPYDPPEPFDAAFRRFTGPGNPVAYHHALDPREIEFPTGEGRILRYDGEIAANDHYIGLFLDLLAERNLRENTVVVIISDHGEFLGEGGRWGHSPPGLLPVIHVPLIISYPRLWQEGKRIESPVQMLDVMPTVLELAGVSADSLLLQGKSLLPLIENPDSPAWKFRPIFSEEVSNLRGIKTPRGFGSIFWGGKHYLFSHAREKSGDWSHQSRVFLLTGNGGIPVEAGEEEVASAYRLLFDLQQAGAAISRNIREGAEEVQYHDQAVIEQLRALGYLQ